MDGVMADSLCNALIVLCMLAIGGGVPWAIAYGIHRMTRRG